MIIGISSGFCMIGIKDFNYKSVLNSDKIETTKYEYDTFDNIFFNYPDDADYIESDLSNIVVEIKHSKNALVNKYEYEDGQVQLYVNYNDFHFFKLVNDIIDDINNKEIINYDDFEIKIYASKENIDKLKQNRDSYYEKNYSYYSEMDNLRKENAMLYDKVYSMENEINNLKNKIYDLETK
jgi:regulator of replication initiation timing